MEMADQFRREGETKKDAAARLREELLPTQRELRRKSGRKEFTSLLKLLTDPEKPLEDVDHLEWFRLLISGGKSFDDFSNEVKEFDDATACGLVWTANFVAYRCRTCGITPCMSICADCFHGGDHEGHDFNMFRSLGGGACDCGDPSVMKPAGFCKRHGTEQPKRKVPPAHLLHMAREIVPSLLTRLLMHMRLNYMPSSHPMRSGDIFLAAMKEADSFLDLLHDLCKMGGAMRHVLIEALMDKVHYSKILEDLTRYPESIARSQEMYYHALNALPSPDQNVVIGSTTYPGITKNLSHATLLEELIFWTVIYKFPQKMVTFLLNMLPDNDYKELFTQTFVHHYGCIAMSLTEERSPNNLANRVVHISVQLFSNEDLALRMTDDLRLLEILIKCALNQVMKTAIVCPMTGGTGRSRNKNQVVNCDHKILKGQCYWPIISDLTNIISHKSVAAQFFGSSDLMALWARFLRYFMGMNLNVRELNQHVEFESSTYSTAFSAEIESCAAPMWQMTAHCKDPNATAFTLGMLKSCMQELCHWLNDSRVTQELHRLQVSFHLPLLRYFSIFLSQALNVQGIPLEQIQLDKDILTRLMVFPQQIQAKLSEIFCGMWVRNGVQMKCQAMTYLQCHFCASMSDLDLYFLQVCASILDPDFVVSTIFKRFQVLDWLSIDPNKPASLLEPDRIMPMIEGALQHIAMLVSIRTHLGMTERELMREEMVSLLAMQDRTYSHLMDKVPEKTGLINMNTNFDELLGEVADFRNPLTDLDGVQQGQYSPKASVWNQEYDPLRTMLRSIQRKDFQSSLDRYTDYLKQSGQYKGTTHPWPPYQRLKPISPVYQNLRRLLHSKVLHAAIFSILYKTVKDKNVSDSVLCLCVALLSMGVQSSADFQVPDTSATPPQSIPVDGDLSSWFDLSSLTPNLARPLAKIQVKAGAASKSKKGGFVCRSVVGNIDYVLQDTLNQELSNAVGVSSAGAMSGQGGAGEAGAAAAQGGDVEMEDYTEEEDDEEDEEEGEQYDIDIHAYGGAEDLPSEDEEPEIATAAGYSGNEVLHEGGQSVQSAIESVMDEFVPQSLGYPMDDVEPTPDPNAPGSSQGKTKRVIRVLLLKETRDVPVGESLISLLVKLHSKLAGKEGSYVHPNKRTGKKGEQSAFGSGPHYIQTLLDQICALDQARCQAVEAVCYKPEEGQGTSKPSPDSAAERRRKAQEAQKKLVAKFASQQMKFLEQTLEEGEGDAGMEQETTDGAEKTSDPAPEKEYECVICGQTSPSTPTKPIGLVTLMQPTNVLGLRCLQDKRTPLPTGNDASLTSVGRCWREEMQRISSILENFSKEKSWEAVSAGWEGGVHIQTCGHALHLDCHKAYLNSLRGHGYQSHDLDVRRRGEYQCPLCRQLANSVLPFVPIKPTKASSLERRKSLLLRVAHLLNVGKKPRAEPEVSPEQNAAIQTFVNDLWRENECDELEDMKHSPVGLFPRVCSIARINLELEIVSAGGSLVNFSATGQKRSCLKPLLQVLELHARDINQSPDLVKMWNKLSMGYHSNNSSSSSSSAESEVPLMVCDPAALFLLLVFSLPQPIERAVFQCVVSSVYNLVYIQALAALSFRLPESERRAWQSSGKPLRSEKKEKEVSMAWLLSDVITRLSQTNLYQHADFVSSSSLQLYQAVWSPQTVEDALQLQCLPWLRISSLVLHYLFDEAIPVCENAEEEFRDLAKFLCLRDADQAHGAAPGPAGAMGPLSAQCFKAPPRRDPSYIVGALCNPFCTFVGRSHTVAKDLLMASPTYSLPRLLQLPGDYDSVFQRYNQQVCITCKKKPDKPLVCLVCGRLVCWGTSCCKGSLNTRDVGEGIAHAHFCGKGTAMYLDINSSATLLIRGERKCNWASLYLDSHGEEDIDLRRGKPLFLCEQRHILLERLWRSHALDHNCKRWEWHHGGLDRRRAFPLTFFN